MQDVLPDRPLVFLGTTAIIESEAMQRLMQLVERVARSNASVLITGESGSGKEVVARAIHFYSLRSHRPWVDLSCAALPENLLESELFGHERGAFSGADSAKPGLFELADQGTIFLDEIGELDPRMQVKLLRVLDGVPYYRLGGVKKVSSDVRVVAATNRNLERAVAEGQFRDDLYHRLSQFTIAVPPLRARTTDIGALALHFLALHDPNMYFSRGALASLQDHGWPGNIRELRNTVLQAAVMATGREIDIADLHIRPMPMPAAAPESILPEPVLMSMPQPATLHGWRSTDSGWKSSGGSLDNMERRLIFEALRSTGGHQQRAAERLGISRRTLSRKLKLYEADFARAAG